MSETKFLLKNSLWFLSYSIFSRTIPFLLLPVYTSYLSPEDYGILAISASVTAVIGIFNTFGMVKFGGRVLFRFHDKKEFLSVLLGNIYGCSIIVAFVISFFLSFTITPLKTIFFGDTQLPSNLVVIIPLWTAFFLCISGMLQSCQIVFHQGKAYFMVRGSKILLLHTLKVVVLVLLQLGVVGFLMADLITEIVIMIISTVLLVRTIRPKFNPKKRIILKMALKYGMPFVPSGIGAWFQRYFDRILMLRFSGMWDVGLYSFAFAFAGIFNMLWFQIRQGITPAFVKKLDDKRGEGDEALSEYSEYVTLFFALASFVGLVIGIYSKEIIHLIANERFHSSYLLIPIFILSMFFQNAREIFEIPVTLKYKTWFFTFRTFMGAMISVILNILLIPSLGGVGAATSMLITFLIIMIVTIVYAQRLLNIPYRFGPMIFCVIGASLFYLISLVFSDRILWVIFYKFVLIVLFCLFTIYLINKECPVLTKKVSGLIPEGAIYSVWLKIRL